MRLLPCWNIGILALTTVNEIQKGKTTFLSFYVEEYLSILHNSIFYIAAWIEIATLEEFDVQGNHKLMTVKDKNGKMYVLLIECGKYCAEVKTAYKKQTKMSDVTSLEPNVQNDSQSAFTSILSQKQENGEVASHMRSVFDSLRT